MSTTSSKLADYIKREGGKCYYCKGQLISMRRRINSKMTPTVDHKLPLSKGGMKISSNEVACCRGCNTRKRNMSEETFVAMLALHKEKSSA